jgi:hypothetical protein
MSDEKVQPKIPTKVTQPSVAQVKPQASEAALAEAQEVTLQDVIDSLDPFLPEERTPSNWQFEPSDTEGFNLCTNLRTGRQLDIPMSLFNQLLRN